MFLKSNFSTQLSIIRSRSIINVFFVTVLGALVNNKSSCQPFTQTKFKGRAENDNPKNALLNLGNTSVRIPGSISDLVRKPLCFRSRIQKHAILNFLASVVRFFLCGRRFLLIDFPLVTKRKRQSPLDNSFF